MQRSTEKLLAWLPLLISPAAVIVLLPAGAPRWALMWLVTAAIFFSFKWLAWCSAQRPAASISRKVAWWLLWPGMAVEQFLSDRADGAAIRPNSREWLAVTAKTLSGLGLFALGVSLLRSGHEYIGGWCGMFGMVLILHFGTFHLVSCAYRAAGIDAPPIMDRPLLSQSLGEFWGRRWNRAFRDVGHATIFRPIARRFGAATAMWAVFAFSGVIHELGISVPAGAGYGLPMLYFIVQASLLSLQSSAFGKRLALGVGLTGGAITLVTTFGLVPILFHPAFVYRVVVPLMKAICAI